MSAGVRFHVALATRQPLAVAVFTNKPTITVRKVGDVAAGDPPGR
jgi:hypothetical protein